MSNFSGKVDDLSDEVYLTLIENFSNTIFKGLSETLSVKGSIELVWNNSQRYFLADPTTFALLDQFIHGPLISKSNKKRSMELLLPVVELIERGQAEGILQNISHPICIAIMYSPLIALIRHHHQGSFVLTDELTMSIFERCWKAIQK